MGPRDLLEAAIQPHRGFPKLAAVPEGPARAFLGMLLWRVPLGLIGAMATLRGLQAGLEQFRRMEGPMAQAVRSGLPGVAPEDLTAALEALPALPTLFQALPWLLLLVPLGLAGAWLHHSVWDQGCLWILGGLRKGHSWKASFEAEGRAMQVGSVGALFGLASFLPVVGPFLWPLMMGVDLWFWCLRGVALAAFHGCPIWKGVAATLLHGVLVMLMLCGLLALALLTVGLQV
jgi:hypothetical protein